MVFLYCFLRLNLKTRILAARSAPTIVPVTLPPETSSPPSLKDALTLSSTSEPMSPASFSTRITSPGATRYCFPPVSMIACMQTSLLGAGTHGVRRNHWSKVSVYYIGAAGSNPGARWDKAPPCPCFGGACFSLPIRAQLGLSDSSSSPGLRLLKLPYARTRPACALRRRPAHRRRAPTRGQHVLGPQHRCRRRLPGNQIGRAHV